MIREALIPDDIIGPDQRAIIVAHTGHHGALRKQFPDPWRVKVTAPAGSVMGYRCDIIVFFDVDPWDPYWHNRAEDAVMMERIMEESLRCRFADPSSGMPMVFL